MPAYAEEIDDAEDEGVVLQLLAAPVEIVHDAAGKRRRREVPPDDPGRLRLERPSPPGRRPQRRLRRRVRPGHRRHRPVARQRAAVRRRRGRDHQEGLAQRPTRTAAPRSTWIFAGGDAVTGPASVVGRHRRRREGRRRHRRVPHRRQPCLLARDVAVDTAFDPDADPAPRRRAPCVPVLAARRARRQLRRSRAVVGGRGGRRRSATLPALRLRKDLCQDRE